MSDAYVPELHPATMDVLFQYEGKPRLRARLCEGGRYEVAYGVTYNLEGVPFKAGDSITEDEVMPLTLNALAVEGAPVWRALTRPVTPEQAGALALLAFNAGGSAAAGSSVVRYLNEGRYEDAAASFGMWTGATSNGPSPTEVSGGIAPSFPTWEKDGSLYRWLSPEGTHCKYFRRFRGLLRRHHAEGCLSLGLDWREATKNDAISMAVEPKWNAAKGRWEDKIIRQTEFAEVLAVARRYPLQAAPVIPDPIKPEIDLPPDVVTYPDPPQKVEKKVPTPPPPIKGNLPDDFDPNAGVKAMVYSRRFWGWVLIVIGRFSFVTDAGASWLTSTGGVANAIAAEPLLLDAWTGMAVMMVGEGVRWWGEKKATRPLK
jgi:GH24 family phage-related lysozyme (muramidase)